MWRVEITFAVMFLCQPVFVQAQSPPSSGDIAPAVVVKVPSTSLGGEQVATILLPEVCAESRQRYPVLYLLHGGGQDHTAFATRSWFRAQAALEMIIVTPNVGESWYVNSVADPNAKYEDFVVKDLVQYVDSRYRTVATRAAPLLASRWAPGAPCC